MKLNCLLGLEWYLLMYKQPASNELKPTGQSITKNSLNLITNEVPFQIHKLNVRRQYIAPCLSTNQNFQSCSNERNCTSSKMSKPWVVAKFTHFRFHSLNLALFLLYLKLQCYSKIIPLDSSCTHRIHFTQRCTTYIFPSTSPSGPVEFKILMHKKCCCTTYNGCMVKRCYIHG